MARTSPDSSPFPITSRERARRREQVFFGDDDTVLYRDLLASQCRKLGVAVFVHLILVPEQKGGARAGPRREAPALFADNQPRAQGAAAAMICLTRRHAVVRLHFQKSSCGKPRIALHSAKLEKATEVLDQVAWQRQLSNDALLASL